MGIRIAVALLAGLAVLVLLAPFSGVDTLPPQCFSVFGYGVPCESGVSLTAGVVAAGFAGLLLWLTRHPRTET